MNYPQTNDIDVKKIEENVGQIPGVPKNPRQIRDERYKQLLQSIADSPEFMQYRPLLLFPLNGKYVCIGGNQRFKGCKELGWKSIPSKIFPEDTSKAKLREYASKDNNSFGEMDWEIAKKHWDLDEMKVWGMEIPMEESVIDPEDFFNNTDTDGGGQKKEKIVITIPSDMVDRKDELVSLVQSALSDYKGVIIK